MTSALISAGSRETIPVAWLSDEAAFTANGIGPGAEMMALGYPMGMAANTAGFAILRSGKVASYPIAPSRQFPTFLLDFTVFPGNSGGPVFVRTGSDKGALLVTGLMTQQLETGDQSLALGVVTQADYIKQAIREPDKPSSIRHVARAIEGTVRYTVTPYSAQSAAAQVAK